MEEAEARIPSFGTPHEAAHVVAVANNLEIALSHFGHIELRYRPTTQFSLASSSGIGLYFRSSHGSAQAYYETLVYGLRSRPPATLT